MKPTESWLDVYLVLLAVGWMDGHLDPRERALILTAARMDGLTPEQLAQLEEAARWPLGMDDLVPSLGETERLYVYTLGSLVVRLDGVLDPVEDAAMDALAQVLGATGACRATLDGLAGEMVASGADPAHFDPRALREAIRTRLAAG